MDEDERKLFELFTQKKDLVNKEPSFVAAFGPSSDALKAGLAQMRAVYEQGQDVELTDAQRQNLSGQRYPEMQGVAGLFAQALRQHPEIGAAVTGKPELWERLIRLDRAVGRALWTAENVWHGGESGELLAAAAANGLCSRVLDKANARRLDPAVPALERSNITTAFTEPNRVDAERKARGAQAGKVADKTGQPLRAQISTAQENAAMSRVIEEFLSTLTPKA